MSLWVYTWDSIFSLLFAPFSPQCEQLLPHAHTAMMFCLCMGPNPWDTGLWTETSVGQNLEFPLWNKFFLLWGVFLTYLSTTQSRSPKDHPSKNDL